MSVPTTACPKCGFQQDGGEECLRCGIVFGRYRAASRASQSSARMDTDNAPARPAVGKLRRFFRICHWATMALLLLVLVLILCPSKPPEIPVTPDAVQSAETKVREFQAAVQQARPETIEMDESELNGWLDANLAIRRPTSPTARPPVKIDGSTISLANKAVVPTSGEAPAFEQVQSAVRDVKIELRQDTLRAYVAFELYGKDLSLELEGRLMVQDGYLRLEPTSGKLGSLPLLAGTLEGAAHRLFDSPENWDKFRLPPQIRDMHIEHGRLIVSSR